MKSILRKRIPLFIFSWYHLSLAMLGAIVYRFPSRRLLVVGVTGTNGKSTVVNLISSIFEEAGHKTASLSSIRFRVGDREWPNTLKMTMPGRFRLQKFLADAVRAGCTHAVIEVTSEGVKQWRHWGIDFDVVVLTNVTPEHIESHGSFEKYREAKGKLFSSLSKSKKPRTVSVVNSDDENAEYFLRFGADEQYCYGSGAIKRYGPGTEEATRESTVSRIRLDVAGVGFAVRETDFRLALYGMFNVYNSLAAISVGFSQGIDCETMKRALEKIRGVPGRFEIVISRPFTVIVDYAHTPDALQNVYKTIQDSQFTTPAESETRPRRQDSKTICVLGAAGGGRDRWKRPEMGKLAESFCDKIILTNEDPYDEDQESILKEIERGFSKSVPLETILDRRQAIQSGLQNAERGSVVIITGKGCEPWMMLAGGKRIPWDDRRVVLEELDKLEKK